MEDSGLNQMTLQVWLGLLKTRFRVHLPGASVVELELAEVTPVAEQPIPRSQASGARTESFALSFNGPAQPLLAQGTYGFEHQQAGQFELFIVPSGPALGGFQYHAVINRFTSS